MASKLHSEILERVIKAPVNLYFDVTPLGRLIENFTKHIGSADRKFFATINSTMNLVAGLVLKISFAIYFSKYLGIALAINIYFLYRVFAYVSRGKSAAIKLFSKQW